MLQVFLRYLFQLMRQPCPILTSSPPHPIALPITRNYMDWIVFRHLKSYFYRHEDTNLQYFEFVILLFNIGLGELGLGNCFLDLFLGCFCKCNDFSTKSSNLGIGVYSFLLDILSGTREFGTLFALASAVGGLYASTPSDGLLIGATFVFVRFLPVDIVFFSFIHII